MDIPTKRADFDAADMAQWTGMVTRLLKGAPVESLDRTDEDGLTTSAFYPVAGPDVPALPPLLPTMSARRPVDGWRVVQTVPEGMENAEILDALMSGASGLMLATADGDRMASQLDGVVLPAVAIGFQGAASTISHYQRLCALAGVGAPEMAVDLGLDPVRDIAAGLALHADAPSDHRLFRIDGWHWHNCGLTAAQELGLITAGLVAALRGADAQGADAAAIAGRLSARLALPADIFAGIAACRAVRRLWDGVLANCDIDPLPLPVHGYASLRMMSVLGPDVNMLRMTTALLGGAIGGADAMAGFGHDILSGESPEARRTARLAQVLMSDESYLAAGLDPCAGSSFIESRTESLADAGWRRFQQIEAAGGLGVALESGLIEGWADEAAQAREARLRAGADESLGVTLQPLAGPVPDILSAHAGIRRPAATVEALRRAAAAAPPRLLILRGEDADTDERKLQAFLAVAGLSAVTLAADDAAGINAARPDWVIGCGVVGIPAGLKADRFMKAAELLTAPDRIAALSRLVDGAGGGA